MYLITPIPSIHFFYVTKLQGLYGRHTTNTIWISKDLKVYNIPSIPPIIQQMCIYCRGIKHPTISYIFRSILLQLYHQYIFSITQNFKAGMVGIPPTQYMDFKGSQCVQYFKHPTNNTTNVHLLPWYKKHPTILYIFRSILLQLYHQYIFSITQNLKAGMVGIPPTQYMDFKVYNISRIPQINDTTNVVYLLLWYKKHPSI